jgi:hypothetical protein
MDPITVIATGGDTAVDARASGTDQTGDSGPTVSPTHDVGVAIFASNTSGVAVDAVSNGQDGIRGASRSATHSGVVAVNDNGGVGIFARGQVAGSFDGRVQIQGDLKAANGGFDGTLEVSGGLLLGGGILAGGDVRPRSRPWLSLSFCGKTSAMATSYPNPRDPVDRIG